ncbi:lipopolysaccharide biosynthesis protein [Stenotrophomonas sp. PSU-St83]
MSRTLKIAKNSAYLYLRMLLVLGASLYTVRVVLQALGVDDFGIYSVAGGIVAIFSFLNNTMSAAAQRFMGIDIGKGDQVALGRTFNATFIVHTAIAVGVVILGETLGMWLLRSALDIPEGRVAAATMVLHLSVAASVALILRTPFNALIISRQRMWFFSLTSVLEALMKLIIAFAISHTGLDRLVLYAALVCCVSWLILGCYMLFCHLQFSESRLAPHREWKIYAALASFISWSFIGSLSNVFRTQGANTLLNVFFGPALNAAHGVMTQAQSAATQFAGSFHLALSPEIYHSYAQGDRTRLQSLVTMGSKLNFILLAILVVPAIHCVDHLLVIWLKTPPPHSSTFIKWMLVNILLETVSQPLMTAAAATGRIRNYQLVVGGVILLNLPLTWLAFTLHAGPESFLYIALAIQVVTFWLRIWFLKRMIDFDAVAYVKTVAVPLLLLFGIAGGLLIASDAWLGPPLTFTDIASHGVLLALPMAAVSIFIGLGKNERAYIVNKLKSRKNSNGK